ncbi:conserved exported hypothetical protein [Thiomonas arsenitoxydans]|uniref:Uncharacterized protein n=2 Tax=root TaxID=1 RepID=D6CTN3_THIA3|nr:hypothetical protein [Thiomonas arsenitoxydans]CQR44492.1 conserved exported hypothetical protein [Thiomonas sp. CB3]CAZ88652.1 hypothetical protein; putative exported protein [Thiomonas arsenitoxydans]CQR27780.1 conserved exported hypothetical protein [Thiomonas arsenitoxydans]CQR31978.1 conserved exported hypothetical protein [Thiomonas arsenitoxydans]CQR34751.1 conserved exported hypothetical protein [Thiomonas arsenitoxydans]
MKPLPKWLLALAIVLFAFYLLLIPEFGAVPFRGQRWEAGAPPPWRESSGWWGPRFGYGMMNGPVRDWGALGVQGDHGYGDDGGYGYGMMGGGIWPAARGTWQESFTPQQRVRIGQIQAEALRQEGALQAQLYTARANLLEVNSVAKPDPAAQAKAGAAVAEILRQIVQIRLQAEQQIQVALSAPSQPAAPSSAPGS